MKKNEKTQKTVTENESIAEKKLEFVPSAFKQYLSSKGIALEKILFCPKFDLDKEGLYQEGYFVLLDDSFFVAVGNKDGENWIEKSFTKYSIDEFEEYKAENFVTTGSLVAKLKDGSYFPLCFYTNTCQRKFGNAANLLSKIKEKEEYSMEDLYEQEREEFCPNCGKRYSDPERKICDHCMKKGKLFFRVLSYGKSYKASIAFICVCILISTALGLIRPIINSKILYDEILTLGGRFYGKILEIVIVIVLFEIVVIGVGILQYRKVASVAANIIYDIKTQLFRRMQNLSMSFYNNKQTGQLMNRVNSDAIHIQYFLVDGLPYFILNAITIVAISIIIISYSPLLALCVFAPIPFIALFIKKIVPRFYKLRWQRWIKSSKLNSVINDSLSGMRVVKAFGKEESEIGRFSDGNTELYNAEVKERLMGIKVFPFLSYIMSLSGLFVWIICGYDVATGATGMTYGGLIQFIAYVGMIYGPLDFMIMVFDWWSHCMTSAQRIFEIMDTKADVVESPNPVLMPDIKGEISIKNVKFEYLPNKPVLHGINLKIKAGEMIGLVGHSGAGKSTITNLITRLYDVNEGSIKIDGVNVKDIKIEDLRSQIGMVLQHTVLFNGTIAENIAYAKPEASMDEVLAASKLANCHDFIMKMRDGYETRVGTGSVRLSGGELQRISIARAILINPKLLILDEATASVDTETESQIQEALERLTKGRTTIAIAHRLSTLRNADRLVVVDKGTIAEVGTHEELELSKGKYYDMLQIQKKALKIGGIIDDDGEHSEEHAEA